MQNRNAIKLRQTLIKLESQQPKLMAEIALIAQEFFKTNFKKQGSLKTGFEAWTPRKFNSGKGRSLLRQSGLLFNEIRKRSGKNYAAVYNGLKYARIHNDGGNIPITPKMRRFFWAQYFNLMKGALNKSGNSSSLKKATKLMPQAQFWKNMAMKKGSVIKIPARPFIYKSLVLEKKISKYINQFVKKINNGN